ncbi:MAG: undecaprenyldiphospho-muramoylpentapeptide beta-N-acetylglucosaminyltransferase [Thermodesulfovibrionia bacterium]|nr:undecaprenyldiphospho-muramoylpentapeptide beta-N-acetylglucosaminyltransferase [Thermodesulfovibrionia bacterium]
MNIVIAGGGTGGHVFPAVAIARELKRRIADVTVTFVGTAKGIEARIIPVEGYDIRFIRSEGVVGKSFFKTIRAIFKVPLSFKDSYGIIKDLKPELVIGVGGYSSGPVVLCAKLLGIHTIIHEQNAVPGLTNKTLGKFVDTVAVTHHESMKFFPRHKTYLTGNPVRKEILEGDRERGCRNFSLDKERFTIFIFGGSSGATHINDAVSDALVYLEPFRDRIQFLHQTGNKDFDSVKKAYRLREFKGTVLPFAYEMADAYAVADLIISRAGATTVAELTACGKAAILVPFPFAAGNHQEINARKLLDIGAAQMILDKDLNGKTLSDLIKYLVRDPDAIGEMERTCKSLGSGDAAKKIVELISALLKKKGKVETEFKKDWFHYMDPGCSS